MSPEKVQKLKGALLRKGFRKDPTHHEMYWLFVGERKTDIRTRISHGAKECGNRLLGLMARQLKLERREFDDLIECPMTAEDYLSALREQDYLSP